MQMPLITLEDIKSQLRLEADYSDEDQYLTLIGAAAESRMSEYPPDYVNQLRVFALLNQFRLQYQEESA